MEPEKRILGRMVQVFFTLFIILVVLVSFYPLVWMMLNSFKTNNEIFQRPLALPAHWDFDVFRTAFVRNKFGRALINSVIVTGSTVCINLVVSALAAFATSHMKFWGRKLFLSFCIGCQVVSAQVLLVPVYKLLRDIQLYDTFPGLILAIAAFSVPLSMYLFNGFFSGFPKDIYESAKIDGCADLRYFFRILAPLSTPIIASVTIFQALFAWNEYIFTLTFLRNMDMWTIQPVIKNMFQGYSINYGSNFAALSIVVVPILAIYVAMQKYFIRGLTAGAVKG